MKPDESEPVVAAGPVTVHGYFIPLREPSGGRIELAAIRAFVRRKRALLLGVAAAFGIAAFTYASVSPPRYRATAVVALVETRDTGGLSLPGQLGSLASLAGVTLPNASERAEHVAFLRSRSLAEEFIRARGIAAALGAEEPAQASLRGAAHPAREPNLTGAIRRFTESVCSVREDNLSGLITVTVRWRDPVLAAEWANALIALANERTRRRAIAESQRTIAFLARELEKTENLELQRAIHRLTQSQLQIAALASVRREYALRVIDPARAPDPDDYVWPRRAVLLPLGLVIGTLAGSLIALLLDWAHASRLNLDRVQRTSARSEA